MNDLCVLVGLVHPDMSSLPYEIRLDERPSQSDLTQTDFGGTSSVAFDGFGQPNSDGSVRIQSGNEVRDVVLDAATGTVSTQ